MVPYPKDAHGHYFKISRLIFYNFRVHGQFLLQDVQKLLQELMKQMLYIK